MFDKLFSKLQRVGKSFMIPIAVLPIAGLLMGIGRSFTNETMIQAYHLQFMLGKEHHSMHCLLLCAMLEILSLIIFLFYLQWA